MKPTIKITANNKQDKKQAKILNLLLKKEWDKYGGVIEQISRIRLLLESIYGIQTPKIWWDNLLQEIVKVEIGKIKSIQFLKE